MHEQTSNPQPPASTAKPAEGGATAADNVYEAVEIAGNTREAPPGDYAEVEISGNVRPPDEASGEYADIEVSGNVVPPVEEPPDEDEGPAPGNEAAPSAPRSAAPAVAATDRRKQRPRNPRLRSIEEAFKNQTPVEGLVKSTNKGGLEIDLAGIRAFCPLSQIELRFCHDPSPYVGQRLRFKVLKYEGARNIVLTRKAILTDENASKSDEVKDRLAAGTMMKGRVTSLVDYGAFVDLGGVTGLVHISELSHGRVAHPRDVLRVGQEVEVIILQVEHPEGRKEAKISLSIKAICEDPWSRAAALQPGTMVHGKVMRLKSFGAFVELWPGVDALIHNSNLADPPPTEASQVVQPGQEVDATVISVDVDKKRIGLSLCGMREPVALPEGGGEGAGYAPRGPRPARPPRAARPSTGHEVGQILQTTVEKVEQFGIFVRLPGGGRGLIPNAEMGTPRGTDHKKQYPEGTEIKAQIIEIGERGRIRLSKKGAENAEERAAFSGYIAEQKESSTLGTLADLMRKKLDERKK
jgi:small subunit ribosomal protein S1